MAEPDGGNKQFLWGAATAAYQIEGSPLADGSGRCVWHEFSHTPGCTDNGDTGDVAADHYNRWRDDIEIMKRLELDAYRFSIRWPRILPDGRGKVNQAGLDFYNRLVDGLVEAGIQPFVTLFHWDLPSALMREGGWSNPDIAGWFGEYANIVAEALSDRVTHWMTLNEPYVVSIEGHLVGNHAPGMRNIYQAVHSIHHQVRAHVAGFHAIKAVDANAQVGLAAHDAAVWPASDSPEDVAACERAEAWHNFQMFFDPLCHGHYPPALADRIAPYLPEGYEDDMPALKVAPDFVGLNYYHGYYAKASDDNWLGYVGIEEPDAPKTLMDWIIRPAGLHRIITQAHERYNLPAIYVTENGASFEDKVEGDAVHDDDRKAYLQSHTAATLQARDEGVPVKGYFVWSLMDNFEWGLGYSRRFGIVHIDYETQKRTIKDSGLWYAELARTGVPPQE